MRGDPVALIRAALICLALCAPAVADPLSEHDWQDDAPQLGGLSGVEISSDGTRLWALSDRGYLIAARITRTEGAITGIGITRIAELLDAAGNRPETRAARDSEGLAVSTGGHVYISYEGDHRLTGHTPDGRVNLSFPTPPDIAKMELNGSFEALAIGPDNTLYTLAERGPDGQAPLYRFAGGVWDTGFMYPRSDGFDPVGMDFDDLGRLYILERSFSMFGGFATRIRRAEITESGLGPLATLLETATGHHPNLEGISLWRDQTGRLIATLVADDNYNRMFRSQIVEYPMPD
ncbi:MAG: esterase-like activity of phytase family protein [Roseicyclus sp.]|nr:esterase-like activity of phytase family protein [Roseicyclus sp.]MBO6625895.1 esterase-like activity of phytase family protein [Roseicyclus sp.]MBO6923502.1 esterase-like activity of phytase family protein [Roseicyclus sp.]